jgi:NAD(P)H-flavin reductase
MVFQIVILVAVILLIRYFFTLSQRKKQALKDKEDSYLVPKDGGVLQKLTKDADGNISLKLGKKIKITGDTYIYRFSFSDPDHSFGLPIGQHVIFSATIPTKENPSGELVQRKYTPTSIVRNTGYVDFVIKVYRKNVHPRFPDGGVMTQYLESIEAGAEMLMEGPKGRLSYLGFGKFQLSKQIVQKKKIGMVAGGTGITPCY